MSHFKLYYLKYFIIFVLGLILGFSLGFKSDENYNSEIDYLSFLVGDHCNSEVKNFLEGLSEQGFLTEIHEVNHDTLEVNNISLFVKIGHPKVIKKELESFVDGSMDGCQIDSIASFDINYTDDAKSLFLYLNNVMDKKNNPVILNFNQGKINVLSRK